MKNLENYGVQPLNAKEIRETTGGGFWSEVAKKLVGGSGLVGVVVTLVLNADVEIEGLVEGWNSYGKQ